MTVLDRLRNMFNPTRRRSITTVDDYFGALNAMWFNGHSYPLGVQQTLAGDKAERITNNLESYAAQAYASNGVVFACMAVRMLVFSGVRFQFQRYHSGRPSELFGGQDLTLLEQPWVGGTTQDLLARMIQDADLAGNSYWTLADGELVRMRPDWVDIVIAPRRMRGGHLGWRRAGYLYTEGGTHSGEEPVPLALDEVVHFAPLPDPLANYRGMSWLTPVIREIQNDGLFNGHKRRFMENAATPNMVIKGIPAVNRDQFDAAVDMMESAHGGADNAGRTWYLTAGVDATVVGSNFQQLDLKAVQGAGETRIAAAAGVPPVIVGLSEGLAGSSLNAGNYGQARRRFADGTMHPLWSNAAGCLQTIVPPPDVASRLWYDPRDVPFLREDRDAAANIQQSQAATMRTLIDAAFKPESVVRAVGAEDWTLLVHTGIPTVQVQQAAELAGKPAATADKGDDDDEEDDRASSRSVTRHLPGKHNQSSHGRRGDKGAVKAAAQKVAAATEAAALEVPPLNLADLTERGDPRADALWYRTGDNSMDTPDGMPGFIGLNRHLRTGGGGPEMRRRVADIDSAMRDSVLAEPIVVLRGASVSRLGTPGKLTGVEFTDKAYVSTTSDEDHARRFGMTVMRITVPPGVSAIRMDDRDPARVESEILLDRGLRFRIVGEDAKFDADGFLEEHTIDVEVIR